MKGNRKTVSFWIPSEWPYLKWINQLLWEKGKGQYPDPSRFLGSSSLGEASWVHTEGPPEKTAVPFAAA